VAELSYDPLHDTENTPDSVFCAHGAGFTVRWDQAPGYMHVSSGLQFGEIEPPAPPAPSERERRASAARYRGTMAEDRELEAIFQKTYGPIKDGHFFDTKPVVRERLSDSFRLIDMGEEYLLVDGYNIIFAWEDLKKIAQDNLEVARHTLMDILSNYQGYRKCTLILVFDAYKVHQGMGSVERYHNIHVVYTKEAETADAYIEKATYELGRHNRVRVATSDGPEQLIILGHGALRLSATNFREEMEQVEGQISSVLEKNNQKTRNQAMRSAMEKAQSAGKKE